MVQAKGKGEFTSMANNQLASIEPFSGIVRGSESNVVQTKSSEEVPSHSPTSLAVEGESASSVTIKWQKPRPEHLTGVITGYIMFALLMIIK